MKSLYQGDTWDFEYIIKDSNDKVVDLTGWKIIAAVKPISGDIILKKNTAAGGSDAQIKIVGTKGKIIISYEKEETALLALGNLTFEIEITSTAGKRYTVAHESYEIIPTIIV